MKKVKIPVKYKKDLLKKFDLRRAKPSKVTPDAYVIESWCPLCKEFSDTGDYSRHICRGCPFYKYSGLTAGCIILAREIAEENFNKELEEIVDVGDDHTTIYNKNDFKKLKRAMLRRIEWVGE